MVTWMDAEGSSSLLLLLGSCIRAHESEEEMVCFSQERARLRLSS